MAQKTVNLKLLAEYTPEPDPPPANAEISLLTLNISANENTQFNFNVWRGIRTDQTIDVDWAFTNVSVSPISGTVRFDPGINTVIVRPDALEVDTDELGELILSNPRLVSGPPGDPILVSPSQTSVRITDTDIPDGADTFPRLGSSAIGGWGQSSLDLRDGGMPGRISRVAAHDVCIINIWRAWTYNGSTGPAQNTSTICDYLRSFNPNLVIYFYTIVTDITDSRTINVEPYITFYEDKADQNQWWLYDGSGYVGEPYGQPPVNDYKNPDTNVVIASEPFPDAQSNGSDSGTVDSNGLRVTEWFARGLQANSGDAGDWATNGYGFRSEYGFDGVYQDIMRFQPRTNGDFDRNGSLDDKEGVVAKTAKWQMCKRYHDEWTALEPDFYHAGNMTFNTGTGSSSQYREAVSYGYDSIVNGVFVEGILGRTSSAEWWGSWEHMMRQYKRAMLLADTTKGPSHIFFDCWQWSDDDQTINVWEADGMTTTDFGRYGLCSCLLDNGYFGYANYGGFTDNIILNEFDFNLGAALEGPPYDGTDPSTSDSGSGYVSYQSGVYKREFENGIVLINPRNNGTHNISLPSPGDGYQWDRLGPNDFTDPVQDSDVNTGERNIASVTLPERHGIIIKRVPLYWPEQDSVTYLPAVRNRNASSAPVVSAGRGFGMDTRHAYTDFNVANGTGIAPTIVHVTNNNASGAGSFHDVLENASDRTIIVFDVGGKIPITSAVNVTANKIWVAGQTAPSLVWIQNDVDTVGNKVQCTTGTELFFQHCAFWQNCDPSIQEDIFEVYTSGSVFANVVLDHCFFGGGTDEILSIDNRTHVTAIDCMVAKPRGDQTLNHAYSSIVGDWYNSWIGNFYTTSDQRSPLWKPKRGALVNNLAYNFKTNYTLLSTDDSGSIHVSNIEGFCSIESINGGTNWGLRFMVPEFSDFLPGSQIYINDSRHVFADGTERVVSDEWDNVLDNEARQTREPDVRVNSRITDAWPEGLVAAPCRSIPIRELIGRQTVNVGPRPNERIQFIQDMIDEVYTQDALSIQNDYTPPTLSPTAQAFVPVPNPHSENPSNPGRTNLEVQLLDLAEGFLN